MSPTESLLEEAPAGSVTAPGVIVVRLAAPLFFANGSVFGDAVKRAVQGRARGIRAARRDRHGGGHRRGRHWRGELRGPAGAGSTARDIDLGFSRVRPDARARLVDLGLLGDNAVYDTNRAAIAALAPGERI